MESLIIKNFGPIEEVNVKFGDLTFLVGPQASGKIGRASCRERV